MCQEEYNPDLVIAIEGDKGFIEIALDIMEIYSTDGGKKNILNYINNLGGFDFEHICTDIENSLRVFVGFQCPWCFETFEVSGFYSLKLDTGSDVQIYMNEFERVYSFRPESYLKAVFSLLVFELLKEYMGNMNKSYVENLFEEEIEYYDPDGEELSSIGRLPDNRDLESDISNAFDELNKDENDIDPDDICFN